FPTAHAKSPLQHVTSHAVGGPQSEIGQRRLRSRRTDLTRELAVEIVLSSVRKRREAVEPKPHEAHADLHRMRAVDFGHNVFDLEGCGLALFRVGGVVTKHLEAGDGQGNPPDLSLMLMPGMPMALAVLKPTPSGRMC